MISNEEVLCWASYCGKLDIVKLLVEEGANIHYKNDYAIRCARANGYLEVVKYLEALTKPSVNSSNNCCENCKVLANKLSAIREILDKENF
jgi:ankyrin repeat protein